MGSWIGARMGSLWKDQGSIDMRIVIVGGSFGGFTTALKLREHFKSKQCEILLISRDRQFVFIPSLPWVAIGSKNLRQISFDLEKPLGRRDVNFEHATVRSVDPEACKVFTETDEYSYDYLVIASGHRSANESVPGLGPFDGPGHSLMSPSEAQEAREAFSAFLEKPGPVVVGCVPGASCIGPAYEFAFEIDHLLRKRRIRHKVPMTMVTPEPFLGHFGVGGMGNARQFLEGELEKRDIHYLISAAVSRITESSVELESGETFKSYFSLIIPPLAGVSAVAESPGLANPKGFVPVDDYYCHVKFPNVYAVGVAVALPPVDETPVPVNFPKTGHMTQQMAAFAAHNIAAQIQGREKKTRDLYSECILDMGDKAAYIKADPVRPPRNVSRISEGRRWLWAKKIFEHYYLSKARKGKSVAGGWGW